MTRLPSLPIAAYRRKALVALLVLGAHAWLVSLRFPAMPRDPRSGDAASRISVRLIPDPVPESAARPRATAAPAPAPRGRPRMRERGPDAMSSLRSTPESPPGAGSAGPTADTGTSPVKARSRRSIVPDSSAVQLPSTLAERAQERIGPATGANPLQRGIEGSARPDCKQAYAGLVLLAIPALLRDALREDGCKW